MHKGRPFFHRSQVLADQPTSYLRWALGSSVMVNPSDTNYFTAIALLGPFTMDMYVNTSFLKAAHFLFPRLPLVSFPRLRFSRVTSAMP